MKLLYENKRLYIFEYTGTLLLFSKYDLKNIDKFSGSDIVGAYQVYDGGGFESILADTFYGLKLLKAVKELQ